MKSRWRTSVSAAVASATTPAGAGSLVRRPPRIATRSVASAAGPPSAAPPARRHGKPGHPPRSERGRLSAVAREAACRTPAAASGSEGETLMWRKLLGSVAAALLFLGIDGRLTLGEIRSFMHRDDGHR